jgi:hypothetical protein
MTKEKKPVYEAPKAFKLEEREAVYGGQIGACAPGSSPPPDTGCYDGTNASFECYDGNNGDTLNN